MQQPKRYLQPWMLAVMGVTSAITGIGVAALVQAIIGY